jgi:uncharacterized protein (DUF433 family)
VVRGTRIPADTIAANIAAGRPTVIHAFSLQLARNRVDADRRLPPGA